MKHYSKLWRHTPCNPGYLADMSKCSPDLGKIIKAHRRNGFFYIRGVVVSDHFLDRVERELQKTMLSYFGVTNAFDLFSSEFIGSLTGCQRAVLGDCVLLLLEQGRVPMDFAEPGEAA